MLLSRTIKYWSLITQCVQVFGTARIALFGHRYNVSYYLWFPPISQITFHTMILRSAVNPQPKTSLYRPVFPILEMDSFVTQLKSFWNCVVFIQCIFQPKCDSYHFTSYIQYMLHLLYWALVIDFFVLVFFTNECERRIMWNFFTI